MARANWKRSAVAFALGAGTVAGFAPFELFPLPLITLAWLLRLGERAATPAAAFRVGFWFGLGLFLAGVSWVYVSLHDFGAMPAPLAVAVTALFCAYLALYPAIALAAAVRVQPDWLRRCIVFPGAWVAAGAGARVTRAFPALVLANSGRSRYYSSPGTESAASFPTKQFSRHLAPRRSVGCEKGNPVERQARKARA